MIRVVVVDDEALVRSGFELILSASQDIEVVATASGGDAVEAVRRVRPDVVLLDIRMPDVDGLTVLRELRTMPEPPVVAMLTTFDADEYILTALHCGGGRFPAQGHRTGPARPPGAHPGRGRPPPLVSRARAPC